MSDDTRDEDLLDEFGLGGAEPAPTTTKPSPTKPPNGAQSILDDAQATLDRLKQNPAFQNHRGHARHQSAQLSFGPIDIAPGATETIEVRPSVLFRGEKLIVSESVPGTTVIAHFFVGQKNQMPSTANVPSAAFAPNNLGSGMRMDTCQPGLTISIAVKNTSQQTVRWTAALFGKTVQ